MQRFFIMKDIQLNKQDVLQRFLRYVAIDTQSAENSATFPSTAGQLTLANLLAAELQQMGMSEVKVDKNGYVYATLPANTEKALPVLAFFAHLDTTPDVSGKDVQPRVIEAYDGEDVSLNKTTTLSVKDNKELANYKGQTLIVTDGTTCLGADDKAGVAAIMSAMHYMINHPQQPHGKVKVVFTPDEEIGCGTDRFDVKSFGADFAVTIDGGPIGEVQYENFNAEKVEIIVHGKTIHPGDAKDKMIDAVRIGAYLVNRIPTRMCPDKVSGKTGFIYVCDFVADTAKARLNLLLRDFEESGIQQKRALLQQSVAKARQQFGCEIDITFTPQYKNMATIIKRSYSAYFALLRSAMKKQGVKAVIKPIRGGTDGARLTEMGLGCPNLFAGGHNFHSIYEYVPLESIVKSAEVIVRTCQELVKKRGVLPRFWS